MFRAFLRPVAALAALSGLAAYATIMLRGPQGLEALAGKHSQIESLQEYNDRLKHEIELKRARIQRLTSDRNTQEVELQIHGYVHEGDTRFTPADPSVKLPVGGAAASSPKH
jgi:hypothetical protein